MFDTSLSCASPSEPIRVAAAASMVATLAQRTTEGAGNPASSGWVTSTSPAQGLFFALVIISTQSRPSASCNSEDDTTRAGRCCLAGFSPYGNGTLMTSPGSKAGIGFFVLFAAPLVETAERVFSNG